MISKKIIRAGDTVRFEDLTWKRPGSGISPRYIDNVIGKKAVSDIEEDSVLKWNMIE